MFLEAEVYLGDIKFICKDCGRDNLIIEEKTHLRVLVDCCKCRPQETEK